MSQPGLRIWEREHILSCHSKWLRKSTHRHQMWCLHFPAKFYPVKGQKKTGSLKFCSPFSTFFFWGRTLLLFFSQFSIIHDTEIQRKTVWKCGISHFFLWLLWYICDIPWIIPRDRNWGILVASSPFYPFHSKAQKTRTVQNVTKLFGICVLALSGSSYGSDTYNAKKTCWI